MQRAVAIPTIADLQICTSDERIGSDGAKGSDENKESDLARPGEFWRMAEKTRAEGDDEALTRNWELCPVETNDGPSAPDAAKQSEIRCAIETSNFESRKSSEVTNTTENPERAEHQTFELDETAFVSFHKPRQRLSLMVTT
jgi:hypothetical protein